MIVGRKTLLELMHLPDGEFRFGRVLQYPAQDWTVEIIVPGRVINNIQVSTLRLYVDDLWNVDPELAERVDQVIAEWNEKCGVQAAERRTLT